MRFYTNVSYFPLSKKKCSANGQNLRRLYTEICKCKCANYKIKLDLLYGVILESNVNRRCGKPMPKTQLCMCVHTNIIARMIKLHMLYVLDRNERITAIFFCFYSRRGAYNDFHFLFTESYTTHLFSLICVQQLLKIQCDSR